VVQCVAVILFELIELIDSASMLKCLLQCGAVWCSVVQRGAA